MRLVTGWQEPACKSKLQTNEKTKRANVRSLHLPILVQVSRRWRLGRGWPGIPRYWRSSLGHRGWCYWSTCEANEWRYEEKAAWDRQPVSFFQSNALKKQFYCKIACVLFLFLFLRNHTRLYWFIDRQTIRRTELLASLKSNSCSSVSAVSSRVHLPMIIITQSSSHDNTLPSEHRNSAADCSYRQWTADVWTAVRKMGNIFCV